MFRGTESSNRIELSQLVQDLLNFGVLGSLQLKSVENSPPIGGCMISWVGQWVDGWDQVKSLKFNKC